MPASNNVQYIFIHCSAGYSGRKGIEAFWKSKGWRAPGYHRLVELDGKIEKLAEFNKITNGVLGYNNKAIHICYVGGVEKNNVNKALDSRTPAQKESIIKCIKEAKDWLKLNGNTKKIIILGHRDASPDKNGNGVIEPFERIKECPSFNAKIEYENL
jgi:N-acetylmuramoyl-L-alanine amidase